MKLCAFETLNGVSYGTVTARGIIDLQSVRHREAKARRRQVLREARFDSGRLEAGERVPHKRQEGAAGAVELDRVRTTVDQVNADPLLQRLNVARESGLRNGARFSGPRIREMRALEHS